MEDEEQNQAGQPASPGSSGKVSVKGDMQMIGRPFVKRFALCYQTVVSRVCLSVCPVSLACLSVTLVYCGQTVGQIKVKLAMRVGLSHGHIVLDGDPARPPKGAQPPNFRPVSIVTKRLNASRCHLVWR